MNLTDTEISKEARHVKLEQSTTVDKGFGSKFQLILHKKMSEHITAEMS